MHRHFSKRHEHHSRHPFGGHGLRSHLRDRMRGHREGRLLEHGDLRMLVLALLAEKARHGYEVMRDLEDRTGGAYRPSPGVIYPTISLLEDEGFIAQIASDGGRKAFEATEAGRRALAEHQGSVDAIFARLDAAAAQSSGSRPKLQRAMKNLETALALRMQRGDVTDAQVDGIAAIIDAAAGQVERT